MKNKLDFQEEKAVIYLYSECNYGLEKLAELFNVSIKPITNTLKKYEVKRRPVTKAIFDESYFDKIDSNEKAYFLGLLMADGCNFGTGVEISLQDSDYDIIEKFKKSILYSGNINRRPHTNPKYKGIVRIKINSTLISEQLTKLGVVPKKSLIAEYPIIEEKYDSHFIRGLFDGDGSISLYKSGIYDACEFSIIGTKNIVESVRNKIINNCGVKYSKLYSKNNSTNTFTFKKGGRKEVLRIYDWLYADSNDFYIKRKFLKFKEIKNDL